MRRSRRRGASASSARISASACGSTGRPFGLARLRWSRPASAMGMTRGAAGMSFMTKARWRLGCGGASAAKYRAGGQAGTIGKFDSGHLLAVLRLEFQHLDLAAVGSDAEAVAGHAGDFADLALDRAEGVHRM